MNITLDDTSPQLRFQSSGVEWYTEHGSDTGWEQCYAQTFSTTNVIGASMSIRFNGTAVYVYGTRWANHGLYEVVLDDSVDFFDGTTPDNGRLFQQCLYAATGLSDAPHTLTITNTPNLNPRAGKVWLDIDYVVITAAAPADEVYTTQAEYDSPAWTYMDGYASGWTPQPSSSSSYTYANNASAQLAFTGTAVQVFGAVGPQHGNYSVWVDGERTSVQGTKAAFNGSYANVVQQTSLVVVSGLEEGDHTLLIGNVKTDQGSNLDIAYAIVNSSNPSPSGGSGGAGESSASGASGSAAEAQTSETPAVQTATGTSIRSGAIVTASTSASMATIPVDHSGGSGPSTADANSGSSSSTTHGASSSAANVGPIVGGALAGVAVLLVALAVGCVWARRRRRQRRDRTSGPQSLESHPSEKVSGWLSSVRRAPQSDAASVSVSEFSVFRSLFVPYLSRAQQEPGSGPAGLVRTHADLPPLDIPRSSALPVLRYTWNQNPPRAAQPLQSRFSPESTLAPSGVLGTTTAATTTTATNSPGPRAARPTASPQDTSPSSTLKTDILNLPYRPEPRASVTTTATGLTGWWSQTTLSVFGRERDAGPALPPNYQQATQKKRPKPSPV